MPQNVKNLKNILNLKFYGHKPPRKKCPKGKKLLYTMSFFGPTIISTSTKEETSLVRVSPVKITLKSKGKSSRLDVSYIVKGIFIIYESFRVFLRALRLCLTFTPIFILHPISYLGSGPEDLWWKLFVKAIELSGPICIKFAQWASTRRDLFSDVCCSHLSRLQRRTQPHSWYYTKLRIAKAFGKNWRKIFVKFDNHSEPIGSGCVAQVYKVWMNEDAIEDKAILEEINFDQDDDEEPSDSYLSDGLEVLGFNMFWQSTEHMEKEQEEIMEDWRRNRELDRKRKLVSDEPNGPTNIEEVTAEVAQEFISPSPNENSDSNSSNLVDIENLDESNVEQHALVEHWQQDRESLEKHLPSEDDQPLDMQGLVPVAIKVLHPGVYTVFRRDLAFFKFVAFCLNLFPPLQWICLPKCVAEFSKIMSAQIDLRIEARNLEKFSEAFADVNNVKFPKPLRPYVSRSVLVETYEDGEPMLNYITEEKSEAVKKNLAQYGVDMLLKMIFKDNFVHGDLHPGNILVQNVSENKDADGNEHKVMMVDVGCDIFVMDVQPDPKPMRICILDCGIVAALKPKDLQNLTGVLTQVVLGNGGSVADLFLENSFNDCKNPDEFRKEMTEIVDCARENSLSLGQVDVGILLQQVLSLLMRHKIRLESAMSSVILAVFVLEGLGRSLDPDMDILGRARPLLVTGI